MDVKPGDVNKPNEYGSTPLFYVDTADEATALIAAGANVNYQTKDKDTPLFAAIREDNCEVAKLLIDAGANINAKDEFNNTPLFAAIREDNREIAKLLIDAGANINAKNGLNETPLFAAVSDNSCEVAKLLIDAGVNVNATNELNQTPLFVAESAEMVNILVKGGVDVDYVDDHEYGGTALDHMRYSLEHAHSNIEKESIKKVIDALENAEYDDDNDPPAPPVIPSLADSNAPSDKTINPTVVIEEKKIEEVTIPPETGQVICQKWNNDLFVDGSELYYKIKMEQPVENQEEPENSNSEVEFYVMCHVKLNYASDIYCGSSVTCELESKYNTEQNQKVIAPGLPMEGTWFIDKNGIYHFDKDQFKGLVKTSDTGKCTRVRYVKYINCEAGTLAWEYEPFTISDPLIPLSSDVKVYEVSKSDSVTTKKTVSRTGTVMCYHYAVDGINPIVDDICVDDTKGPSSFKKVRSGTANFTLKGSLRTKSKK